MSDTVTDQPPDSPGMADDDSTAGSRAPWLFGGVALLGWGLMANASGIVGGVGFPLLVVGGLGLLISVVR